LKVSQKIEDTRGGIDWKILGMALEEVEVKRRMHKTNTREKWTSAVKGPKVLRLP
jgi:hypothetical protein